MTALPDEAIAYHLGVVVADLDAALGRYGRLLPAARMWRTEFPVARLAFLRAAALTFELIEPRTEEGPYAAYLRERGEGVQHIGFWVPDVRAAVAAAVAEGARVTQAVLDGGDRGAVSIRPGDAPPDLLGRISPGGYTYLDAGVGGVELELVGPASEAWMRELLGEDFDRLLVRPPWA